MMVTLMNTGTAPATIDNVVVANAGAASAVLATPATLQPGASVLFPVSFAPMQLGSAMAVVEVWTSVATMPLRLPLSGSGRSINLSPTHTTLDFGMVSPGTSTTRSLLVTNIGFQNSGIISFEVVPPGHFSVMGAGGVLAPGEAMQFDITFTTTASSAPGTWSAVLEITATNDFLSIPLSASTN